MTETICRCPWCGTDPLYISYHDHQWGVPLHDDSLLFEMLTLEGAQAGLSWLTILRKRDGYRTAFEGFDIKKIAAFGAGDSARLLTDSGIVRNRLKISSTITNARAALDIQRSYGTLDNYLWSFVNGVPLRNHWQTMAEIPARTPLSDAMSKDLKRHGFRFVGSTICYAFMQATGRVNDHLTGCFCYEKAAPITKIPPASS